MSAHKELIEEVELRSSGAPSSQRSETSIYVTDLLGELQIIARLGGLQGLSDDIESIIEKHLG